MPKASLMIYFLAFMALDWFDTRSGALATDGSAMMTASQLRAHGRFWHRPRTLAERSGVSVPTIPRQGSEPTAVVRGPFDSLTNLIGALQAAASSLSSIRRSASARAPCPCSLARTRRAAGRPCAASRRPRRRSPERRRDADRDRALVRAALLGLAVSASAAPPAAGRRRCSTADGCRCVVALGSGSRRAGRSRRPADLPLGCRGCRALPRRAPVGFYLIVVNLVGVGRESV